MLDLLTGSFVAVPPPVVSSAVYNATVVNRILPQLIPRIAAAATLPPSHVVDIFDAFGGRSLRPSELPTDGCHVPNATAAVDLSHTSESNGTRSAAAADMCQYFCVAVPAAGPGTTPRNRFAPDWLFSSL